MLWYPYEIGLFILTVTLAGLTLYKLLGPSYPWEVITTEQYLTELVENVTQGIEKTQQSEIPIPDIQLSFPETGTSFHAKSGSVFDMSSLVPVDYNLMMRNKTYQVIELRMQLNNFQVVFQQYTSKDSNNIHKGSCVCESDVGGSVIEDITNISVSIKGAEDDYDVTKKLTNWVIDHVISNVKHTVEMSIEESSKRFATIRHLKCI